MIIKKYEKEFLQWYEGCGLSKGDPIDGTDYNFLTHQECWNTAVELVESKQVGRTHEKQQMEECN